MWRMVVTGSIVAGGILLGVQPVWAANLGGIALGNFLNTFQAFVVGLGLVIGLVGLVGYVGSLFDNPFSSVLQGSIGFFTKAGILGGGVALMGMLGLTGGAVL